jgi:hypothetical protein
VKTELTLFDKPTDRRFAHVARIIAKGEPPEWLVLGLEHLSGLVRADLLTSKEYHEFAKIIEQMHDAADRLLKWLPAFSALSLNGLRCPDDVIIALDVLPRIKRDLARLMRRPRRGGGPAPNIARKFCAAVVVEAWGIIHGKAEPHNPHLWEACDEYWRACGRETRGRDFENWRRDVEEAADDNREIIRRVLLAQHAAGVV